MTENAELLFTSSHVAFVEKYDKILKSSCDEEKRSRRLERLCCEIVVANKNMELSEEKTEQELRQLKERIEIYSVDYQQLQTRKERTDGMVKSFKNLSNELETKMEEFIMTSKEAQKDSHKYREKLTESFSLKVDEISKRLKTMETKKIAVNDEYFKLQRDLNACIVEFENLEKNPLSEMNELVKEESIEDNTTEESCMQYEDYRSHCWKLDEKEMILQHELSQFVDRFQELSNGLSSSNKGLFEHQKRVQELELTLQSLEKQKQKGKQILIEIKRVIDSETKTCSNMRTSIECMKTRNAKYKQMANAFQDTIDNLTMEIVTLRKNSH